VVFCDSGQALSEKGQMDPPRPQEGSVLGSLRSGSRSRGWMQGRFLWQAAQNQAGLDSAERNTCQQPQNHVTVLVRARDGLSVNPEALNGWFRICHRKAAGLCRVHTGSRAGRQIFLPVCPRDGLLTAITSPTGPAQPCLARCLGGATKLTARHGQPEASLCVI